MKKVLKFFCCTATLIALLTGSGCISTDYYGESFPAVNSIEVLPFNSVPPDNCQVIGRGTAQGEYSATTDRELLEKLRKLGMRHGADIMVITGRRLLPAGKVANTALYNFIDSTDDPDQVETETEFNEVISGESSSSTRYTRIMYAEFLRKKP